MSHPLFTPELRFMMNEGNSGEMRTFVETLHPATIAEALTDDDIAPEAIWRILDKTTIRDQAAVFEYFPIETQVELALGAGQPHMARLIEQMSHDDRAALLRRLPPRLAEGLLRLVDEADRRDIKQQLQYPEDSVGGLMTTDYAWLPVNLRAGEAIDRLRLQAPNSETIYYVFILDEATRRLVGVVTLRDLILAQRQAPLREIMETELVTLRADWPRERAAEEMRKYDLIAMPVTDEQGRLVGIVTHDDAIDVVVEEATEDAHRMGAVTPMAENYLDANFFHVWRSRAVWLSVLFVAQMFTFNAMLGFESAINAINVLPFFLPLIISTGGNSGSQAATLIIRAMALGQVTPGDVWRVLRHEAVMGLALGLTLGAVGFLRAYFLTPDHLLMNDDGTRTSLAALAVVIGLAASAVCLWGALIGALLPLTFRKFGVDPGIASSPFVATFVDVTGIVIFFTIAREILL